MRAKIADLDQGTVPPIDAIKPFAIMKRDRRLKALRTMPVQNAEIAAMFDQTADLLEFKGENQFRVRAYHRAARTIEGLPQSVRGMLSAEKDLSELPGIGKDLAGKIADIVKTGHFNLLDQLKRKLPGQLGDMAALPGLGPKLITLDGAVAYITAHLGSSKN